MQYHYEVCITALFKIHWFYPYNNYYLDNYLNTMRMNAFNFLFAGLTLKVFVGEH